MAEPLLRALARMRGTLLDDQQLVRAVASGRRRREKPRWRRVELRYVDLKAGRRLQVTAYDDTQAFTSNHEPGPAARDAVDALLDEPFGNWHVETPAATSQLRVTKKGEAMVHSALRAAAADTGPPALPDAGPGKEAGSAVADLAEGETASLPDPEGRTGEHLRSHDRRKPRLLPEEHPVLRAIGIADEQGRIKPSRQAKYRQVEEFLRSLAPAVDDALASGRLRTPTDDEPLRIVDLGCGNAYLTFAAHAFLADVRGLPVHLTGIDVKAQSREHSEAVAVELGIAERMSFVQGDIAGASLEGVWSSPPDVVLALHACDTATDDALARAVGWEAPLVLAAPCCHHDVAAQLRRAPTPAPYSSLTRHGILRERFADTLTDAVRAAVLRLVGYRVEVIEFVESTHTPRNTLIRATRTGAPAQEQARDEYVELTRTWGIQPRLGELLRDRIG